MDCNMTTPYFMTEAEVRCVLMNSFFQAGVNIWDCDPAGRQCVTPIVMGYAPLVPMTGDFPIFWWGRYYIIEVKWSKLRCNLSKDRTRYLYKKGTRQISRSITKTLLNGGGFLVYVAEPLPQNVNYEIQFSSTKPECERLIDSTFRKELGSNRLPYEVWILDQRRFERVFRGKFGTKSWEIRDKRESRKDRKVLGFRELEATVPEAKVCLTMQEIKEGKVFNLIDQLITE
jgi:hypothetical protein